MSALPTASRVALHLIRVLPPHMWMLQAPLQTPLRPNSGKPAQLRPPTMSALPMASKVAPHLIRVRPPQMWQLQHLSQPENGKTAQPRLHIMPALPTVSRVAPHLIRALSLRIKLPQIWPQLLLLNVHRAGTNFINLPSTTSTPTHRMPPAP